MFNVTRRKSDSSVQQQHYHQPQQQQQQQQQQPQQQHHNQNHHQPSQQQQQTSNYNLIKEKPKFKRSVSIARLFGNAYSTSPHMSRQKSIDAGGGGGGGNGGGSTVKARILFKNRHHNNANVANNKLKIERFKNRSESQIDRMASSDCTDSSCKPEHLPIEDFCDEKDLSARAIRTISKGLSLFWRRSYSVEISTPDPEYKVFYLGNVLTGWAKGDNCIEKPLATLWRNYTQINKPDVTMRILLCSSGLKATTRQHGLTEYWANRITYCCSPKNYPRVFCWIYRHEGRKLKHELRCHAVLCPKESIAEEICKTLKENLSQALKEFKRDKINRQNARLSLVNSLYENPSMPRRKILLSVGANNYRPPMERSKSAPKLMAIEEAVGEEDEIYEISSRPSFKKSQCHLPYYNSTIFSAASIDRKYSRRNRSSSSGGSGGTNVNSANTANVREMKALKRVNFQSENSKSCFTELPQMSKQSGGGGGGDNCSPINVENNQIPSTQQMSHENSSLTNSFDDDDELNSLLLTNDSSLSGEILSYLDNRLSKSSSMLDDDEHTETEIDLHPNGMGHSDENIVAQHHFRHHNCGQSMELSLDSSQFEFESYTSTIDDYCSLDTPNIVCNRDDYVNDLIAMKASNMTTATAVPAMSTEPTSQSKRNAAADDCSLAKSNPNETINFLHSTNGCNTIIPFLLDSDEGSITSGCETSSIITTAHMDELMKSEREIDAITLSLSRLPPKNSISCNLERVSENNNSNQHTNGNNNDVDDDDDDEDDDDDDDNIMNRKRNNNICNGNDSNNNRNCNKQVEEEDSEFSDESGFDENHVGKLNNFQISGNNNNNNLNNNNHNLNCEPSADSTSNADANNNIKHSFSPSATKSMGRLRINIPKNAKSIDI